MSRPTLNDLAAFIAVATHRRFRRAAEELDTAPSTLSHAMRGLEERLGVRLLNRTTRSISPTEAGFKLLDLLKPALVSLDDALNSVVAFRGGVAGTVRINSPRLAAEMLVHEVLPAMAAQFPDVNVDIVVEGKMVDIVSGGFDAGIRIADAIPKDMIAVPLEAAMSFSCVASADYLARAGIPTTPDDLTRHRCIGHRMPSGKLYQWEFERAGQEIVIETRASVILDDPDLMVQAAAKGIGIAYVPTAAARAAVETQRLIAVLSEWMPSIAGLAVYYPGHRAVPPALRAFLDIVKQRHTSL
jgi:DNA-binding transcriptional LysR family regulator